MRLKTQSESQMRTVSFAASTAARTAAVVLTALLLLAPVCAVAEEEGGHGHKCGGDEHEGGHGHEEEGGHEHEEAPAFDATSLTKFGVKIKAAGPAQVRNALVLAGKIVPHEDRVAHVTPRYPGVIREARKRLGDPVAKGEVVAVVESNQTLQVYEVKSLLAGVVTRRHANPGEFVDDQSDIFEVADYSVLFADLYAFPTDFSAIRLGQKVVVQVAGRAQPVETTISFISPITDPATQARFVRGVLPNPDGAYQIGSFVSGEVVLDETPVPVAVDSTAVRVKGGQSIVFVEHENRFEPRTVRVGRRDRNAVEILAGLDAGDRYAAGNTFLVQAELEKGEAEHEH